MILSGHQPTYLPGIILFNKIALSDKFLFVGHCQASPGTWHNRNQIRGAKLTIPVKNDFGVSINDTILFDSESHWRRKHLRSIYLAYAKAPFFDHYFGDLAKLINEPWDRLGPMNMAITEWLCMKLRIETEILDSRDYPNHDWGQKTDMLIDMCEAVGADRYLSNEGSRSYVDENKLATAGITHCWQSFKHPVYEQGHPEFLTNLSVIDLLFNKGPEAGQIVRASGAVG